MEAAASCLCAPLRGVLHAAGLALPQTLTLTLTLTLTRTLYPILPLPLTFTPF